MIVSTNQTPPNQKYSTASPPLDDNNNNTENDTLQDAKLIFDDVWTRIESKFGVNNISFPREVIWLSGAPGAGKGTMSNYIMQATGIFIPPIETSSLLNKEEFRKKIDSGILLNDSDVLQALLEELLNKKYEDGIIVDGFPRTVIQAHCIKLLYEKMRILRKNNENNKELLTNYHRPKFHIVVLYIDEKESTKRQLYRGDIAKMHNERVKLTGIGNEISIRNTDNNIKLASKRYKIFKNEVYNALQVVKDDFYFHLIDASGTPDEVLKLIDAEFKYQSSLELEDDVFEKIRKLPVINHVLVHSQSNLVNRLNTYALENKELLQQVVNHMKKNFLPILEKQAMAGTAMIKSNDKLLQFPNVVDMVIDVLHERGYYCAVDIHNQYIPVAFNHDLNIGGNCKRRVDCEIENSYTFHISFNKPTIKRGF